MPKIINALFLVLLWHLTYCEQLCQTINNCKECFYIQEIQQCQQCYEGYELLTNNLGCQYIWRYRVWASLLTVVTLTQQIVSFNFILPEVMAEWWFVGQVFASEENQKQMNFNMVSLHEKIVAINQQWYWPFNLDGHLSQKISNQLGSDSALWQFTTEIPQSHQIHYPSAQTQSYTSFIVSKTSVTLSIILLTKLLHLVFRIAKKIIEGKTVESQKKNNQLCPIRIYQYFISYLPFYIFSHLKYAFNSGNFQMKVYGAFEVMVLFSLILLTFITFVSKTKSVKHGDKTRTTNKKKRNRYANTVQYQQDITFSGSMSSSEISDQSYISTMFGLKSICLGFICGYCSSASVQTFLLICLYTMQLGIYCSPLVSKAKSPSIQFRKLLNTLMVCLYSCQLVRTIMGLNIQNPQLIVSSFIFTCGFLQMAVSILEFFVFKILRKNTIKKCNKIAPIPPKNKKTYEMKNKTSHAIPQQKDDENTSIKCKTVKFT